MKYLIAGFVVVVALALASEFRHQGQLQNFQKIQNELQQRNKLLQQQLDSTEHERVGLVDHYNHLSDSVKLLVLKNTKLDSMLNRIPNSYSKKSVPEVESEMIKRYRANQ